MSTRLKIGSLAAAVAFLLAGAPALAQYGPGHGGRARIFDPSTVVTLSGEVTEVRKVDGRRFQGVRVDLRTSEGVLEVRLGPSWYLDRRQLRLAKGDTVEIAGSRVQLAGRPALIAQAVKRGDVSVALRDANGVPAWSRRSR